MSVAGEHRRGTQPYYAPPQMVWRSCCQACPVRIYSKEISKRYDLDHTSFCSEAQQAAAFFRDLGPAAPDNLSRSNG